MTNSKIVRLDGRKSKKRTADDARAWRALVSLLERRQATFRLEDLNINPEDPEMLELIRAYLISLEESREADEYKVLNRERMARRRASESQSSGGDTVPKLSKRQS